MKVVWQRKDVSVREVYETLRERRSVAYTTVMTMMNTLEGKGYVKPEGSDMVSITAAGTKLAASPFS